MIVGMRKLAAFALPLALVLPLACSSQPATPPGVGTCNAVGWGGWDGTPDCAGIATIVIPPEARVCATDSDCVLVGASACSTHAANQAGAARLSQNPPPCNHPLAGLCAPPRFRASCQQGCCVPQKF
jgi:hypothetical protein